VQVSLLPAITCMSVLPNLETGASGNAKVQAAADQLAASCSDRLCTLMAAEGALQAEGEQRALLRLLGPLQEMLNNERRRQVWQALPFPMLRVSC